MLVWVSLSVGMNVKSILYTLYANWEHVIARACKKFDLIAR